MKRITLILSVLLLFLLSGNNITWAAGCCGGGSAPGVGNIGVLSKGTGEIKFGYSYSYRDKIWHARDEVENTSGTLIVNHTLTLSAIYGIAERINIGLNVPFKINNREISSTGYDKKEVGFGDITFAGRYILVEPILGEIVPYVELALKVPTGSDKDDYYLQTGTGSWDPTIGVGFNYNWWKLFTYGRASYSISIGGEDVGQDTVDTFTALLGVNYKFTQYVGASLTMDALRVTKRKIDDMPMGGSLIYIRPGISFGPWKNLSIYSVIGFPIYRHVYCYEPVENYQLDLGLGWRF